MNEQEIIEALPEYDMTYKYDEEGTYPHKIAYSYQGIEKFWYFKDYAECEAFIDGLEHMRLTHKL